MSVTAAILQPGIPAAQVEAAGMRLPQVTPVAPGEWLRVDAAYAGQLAQKARLIAERRADVIAVLPGAEAAEELLEVVLTEVAVLRGFDVMAEAVMRPDGVVVALDRGDPLLTLSRILQEDFCIHEKRGAVHMLTAALLCFPAAWTLAEKIGRPLTSIHLPMARYDADVAARVRRMFDMVRAERPLWRANLLRYVEPSLFQPQTEANPRAVGRPESPYRRSERQTNRRLLRR